MHFLPAVVERDRKQDEFTKTIWDYLDSAVSDERIANGKAALAANQSLTDGTPLARGGVTYGKLLSRQVRRAFGVRDPGRLDDLAARWPVTSS